MPTPKHGGQGKGADLLATGVGVASTLGTVAGAFSTQDKSASSGSGLMGDAGTAKTNAFKKAKETTDAAGTMGSKLKKGTKRLKATKCKCGVKKHSKGCRC